MTYVITQISQAVKNIERANLYLNGKFWIGLNKNDLITLKLFKGKELTDSEKRDIEKTALNKKLIDKAIYFLQVRPRSRAEVRDYLVYRKAIPADEAENIVLYLEEHGLLSDEKFAKWYIDYKLSTGVNGINKIKTELMLKKVDMKTINDALEIVYTAEEFEDEQRLKIEEYANKIVKNIKGKDAYEIKSKLIQRLMARGFKYTDIKKVVSISQNPLIVREGS